VAARDLAIAAGAVIVWLLVSRRAERFNISPALALVLVGVLLANGPWAVIEVDLHTESVTRLAEATLALVLFCDASRVSLRRLRADVDLPVRLLVIGLPLTILLGIGVSILVVPHTGVWVAAAIAAIVAPTDAALGASILADKRIPGRIRQALNVESGLNDGIATPFVNLFIAGALAGSLGHSDGVRTAIAHLVVGGVFGAAVGTGGGLLIRAASRADWMSSASRPLAVLGVAALAYLGALPLHGNGFISAFVAGMAFGTMDRAESSERTEFTSQVAEGLTLLVWFVFGSVLFVPAIREAHWADVLFAVLALTVVRMVPVALALVGSGLDAASVALVGWFGPRGLASVVFTLIAIEELDPADGQRVLSVVSITIAASVLAHGVSASPLARVYGSRRARHA
jgi:NhaP-type Na+/H+ or K+/H+ antiporter